VVRSAIRRDIPSRERLMARLRAINRETLLLLLLEAIGGIATLASLDFTILGQHKALALAAVAAPIGHALWRVAQTVLQRKTNVESLADGAQLGHFTKAELLDLIDRTLGQLGLSRRRIPVYLLRSKDPNTCSSDFARTPFRALKAVYLNRALLHMHTPDEIRGVLGHELGHNVHYALLWDRYLIVHVVFGALLSLIAVQYVVPYVGTSLLSLIVVLLVVVAWEAVIAMPWRTLGQDIEFLCDDLGARLAGPVTTIRQMLMTGLEVETRAAILREALLQRAQGRELSGEDAVAAYEKAVPWGRVSGDTYKHLMEALDARRREAAGLSFGGFLSFLGDDGSEEADDVTEVLGLLRQIPCIDRSWLSGIDVRFGAAEVEGLVATLEENPDQLLFRSLSEIDGTSLHPSFRRRILYIWRHRDAIAVDAAKMAA
jgi:Zn-dependent protease with chaperone function